MKLRREEMLKAGGREEDGGVSKGSGASGCSGGLRHAAPEHQETSKDAPKTGSDPAGSCLQSCPGQANKYPARPMLTIDRSAVLALDGDPFGSHPDPLVLRPRRGVSQ